MNNSIRIILGSYFGSCLFLCIKLRLVLPFSSVDGQEVKLLVRS
jgi:hypothetical protein